jgi:hypothetical protein
MAEALMALEQQVLRDGTDTLIAYPPASGAGGLIVSPLVRIGTPNVSMPLEGAEDNATLDPVNTAIASNASRGASSITITALTNNATVGRKYLICRYAGDVDPVIVTAVRKDGSTIYLQEPLQRDVASGELVFGFAITHQLTALETDDEGDGLAIWSATIGGNKYTWHQAFKIVKQYVHPDLTADQLLAQYPQVERLSFAEDLTLSEAIGSAWENLLIPSLESRGLYWERIKTVRRLNPALALATIYHLQRADARFPLDVLEASRQEYLRAMDVAFQSVDFWYDSADDEGSRREDLGRVPAYRQLRLSR